MSYRRLKYVCYAFVCIHMMTEKTERSFSKLSVMNMDLCI